MYILELKPGVLLCLNIDAIPLGIEMVPAYDDRGKLSEVPYTKIWI